MKQNKSAKDMAFEKERARLRSTIRELTNCVDKKQKKIDELNEIVSEKDAVIRQQREWIDRLLEYTELSEEEMKKVINQEKAVSNAVEKFQSIEKIISRFGF